MTQVANSHAVFENHGHRSAELAKDSCACGHPLDQHDGGRGGPCNYCGCAAGEPPTAFEVGVIHSLHEVTTMLARLVKEMQAHRGVQ